MNHLHPTNGGTPLTIAAVIVVIASFLPWATLASPKISRDGLGEPQISLATSIWNGNHLPMTMQIPMTLVISAWNGNVEPIGLTLPNWLVVVAAVGVALIAWREASADWKAPTALPLALAGYGFTHASYFMAVLHTLDIPLNRKLTIGVGSPSTALAFATMLYLLLKHRRAISVKPSPPMWGGDQ